MMSSPATTAESAVQSTWSQLTAFGVKSLAWLAVAPAWPDQVARLGFPIGPTSLGTDDLAIQTLENAVKEGLADELPAATPWPGVIYSIAGANRQPVLKAIALNREYGSEFLKNELVSAGEQMYMAGGKRLEYDATLHRWAMLARMAQDEAETARFLSAEVDDAISVASRGGHLSVPEAVRWVDAGQPIADILGGPVHIAVTLARRKIELHNRRAHDKQKLLKYLPREGQDEAIEALLKDENHWALHFVGESAVGKTMLLRYLANNLAEKHGLAVARVDFDYLNPDYPKRAPGLLLMAFSEEFRLQAGPNMESYFDRFESTIRSIHNQIEGTLKTGQALSIDRDAIDLAVASFVDALRSVAETRQPVLALDTCEELAKIHADGTIPDNVATTLEILSKIQDEYRRVRVVFAGRRPLASKGFGWTADSRLPERPNLRLHIIEHFNETEARKFLAQYHDEQTGEQLEVPTNLVADLLELSRAGESGVSKFGLSPSAEARYNASDLDMYADWSCRDPTLTKEKLSISGRNYYVRDKIVSRLRELIRPVVPALALAGRFDSEVLETFSRDALGLARGRLNEADGRLLTSAVREITDQEWIQPDRAAAPNMWRIDPVFQHRLRAYFTSQEPGLLSLARERVRSVIGSAVLERAFDKLPQQYFVVAMDAMLDAPTKAVAWWTAVEQRFAREQRWDWAVEPLALLVADPILASDRQVSLRAVVQATRAAALLHTGQADPVSVWQDALDHLDALPDEAGRKRVKLRAELALRKLLPSLSNLEIKDEDLKASVVAALDSAVEDTERGNAELPELLACLEDCIIGLTDCYLKCFAISLTARVANLVGQRARAAECFQQAVEMAQSNPIPQGYLDWLPPENLAARIALQAIRVDCDVTIRPSRNEPPSIDIDRLWSALLSERGLAFPDGTEAIWVRWARFRPRASAHWYYPPYFVASLLRQARRGEPSKVIETLEKLSSSFSDRPDVALAIGRAILDLRLRFRMLSGDVPAALQRSQMASDIMLRSIFHGLFSSRDGSVGPPRLVSQRWTGIVRRPDG
jgi:hypothetical protein